MKVTETPSRNPTVPFHRVTLQSRAAPRDLILLNSICWYCANSICWEQIWIPMPATIYILNPATEQHSKGSSKASRVWSRACMSSHSQTPTQNLAVGWWLMGKPWNSYIRSESQECRGSGKRRGLPKHRLRRAGISLALTSRMHNCLPLLFVELQSPIPTALSRPAAKCHQGDGKGGQHTELGFRHSSRLTEPALKHAEMYFGFAL